MSFLYSFAKQIMLGKTAVQAETATITLTESTYAMLVKSSHTPVQHASTTTTWRSVFSARAENTDNGWTGVTCDAALTVLSITSSNGITYYDANDVVFPSVSTGTIIHGILIYQRVTNDADSIPVAYINITTVTANGATINVNWDNGVNRIFALT